MMCNLCYADHAEAETCEDAWKSINERPAQDFGIKPGARVVGVWGQGCGSERGIITAVAADRVQLREMDLGNGTLHPAVAHARVTIVWEEGRQSMEDMIEDDRYMGQLAVGVYLLGEIAPDWAAEVMASKAKAAIRERVVKAAAEMHAEAIAATVAEWDAAHPDAKGYSVGYGRQADTCKFAPIEGGRGVRIWTRTTARQIMAGDTIRHGGYNFDYTDALEKVTGAMVVYKDGGKSVRLCAEKFCKLNHDFNEEASNRQRAAWMD